VGIPMISRSLNCPHGFGVAHVVAVAACMACNTVALEKVPLTRERKYLSAGSMNTLRRRQEETENIFLIFRGSEDGTISPAPTGSPTIEPEQRESGNFVSCETGGLATQSALVEFLYDLETSAAIEQEEETLILDTLKGSIVNSIRENTCGRRHLTNNLQIESISPGAKDQFLETCSNDVEHADNSVSHCRRYFGSLVVGYSVEGKGAAQAIVESAVLQRIAADMTNGDYVEEINLALQEQSSSGVGVTTIQYGHYYTDAVKDGGLSSIGMAFIPLLALLTLCMLGSIYLMQRSRQDEKIALTKTSDEDNYYVDQSPGGDYDDHDLAPDYSKTDFMRSNKPHCSETFLEDSSTKHSQTPDTSLSMDDASTPKEKMGLFSVQWTSPGIVDEIEETDETEESFEDEPNSVTFLKMKDGRSYAQFERKERVLARKRVVVDDGTGCIRNELAL